MEGASLCHYGVFLGVSSELDKIRSLAMPHSPADHYSRHGIPGMWVSLSADSERTQRLIAFCVDGLKA